MPGSMSARGFLFKDRTLQISHWSGDVEFIESWPKLRARIKRRQTTTSEPFEPLFQLVHPYRRDRVSSKPAPPVQMELAFPTAKKPAAAPTLDEQRKRAFDKFRLSLPNQVANAVERFRSHQWRLLRLFH